MPFNKDYFDHYGNGEYKDTWNIYCNLADVVSFFIRTKLAITTALDLGCAFGQTIEFIGSHGIETKGIDNSEYVLANKLPSVANKIIEGDFIEYLKTTYDKYDLIYSNSLTYIPADKIDEVIENLAKATKYLAVSIGYNMCFYHKQEREVRKIHRSKEWWDSKLSKNFNRLFGDIWVVKK